MEVLKDATHSNNRAYYQYNITTNDDVTKGDIKFLMLYPKTLYWKVIGEGSLAIVDTVTEVNKGYKETGDIHLITVNSDGCKFNKLRSKGGFNIIDPLDPSTSLPTSNLKEFDYCCLMNKKEIPFFYYKKDNNWETEILNQKDAVDRLPYQVEKNDLRFNLTNDRYYRGLTSNLKGKNVLDPSKFSKSYSIAGINFINNEDGTYTVDGVATGRALFTV